MLNYRVQNAFMESVRHKDENGYIHIDKSPILRAGILEYLGSELLPEGQKDVDGVKVDPDKIYKVFIPEEELRKGAESFKLLPITNDHTWLGEEGEDAKEFQEGTIGENVYVQDGKLYAPLMFTGSGIIEDLEGGKEELSSSYYNRFEKSENTDYDFIARDIKGNHLALVDKGRCGSAVRVLNSNIKGVVKMAVKAKTSNEAILKLDGKEINLDQFFEEESQETDGGVDIHEESIAENEDKRAVIDEIGGMLKDKVDEELWRTIVEKLEKIAYEPSEESESDNEDIEEEAKEDEEDVSETENACSDNEDADEEEKEDEDAEKGSKSMNYDAMVAKISNAVKAEARKAEDAKVKAYNAVCGVIGDFNPFGMSDKDMYVKALNHLGVELDGSEKVAELRAMLKACSSVQSKVDNGFSYGKDSVSDEVDYNI
ncbi:MAG: DUF2213 domain-containing protein [Methanobrevibacter sp.]|nr:DUF2213 domain-containing protein [Methanobrevibacter sp.]